MATSDALPPSEDGSSRPLVKIYSDGSCSPNPGPGGWAALILRDGTEQVLQGGAERSTNNRMELTAAIQALEALDRPSQVLLYTDSQYLQRGINEWLPRWKTRRWRTAGGRPVENRDLWERLDALSSQHSVSWQWIRGHFGDRYNTRVDALAKRARPSVQKSP
jgi:ribonuclease HI